MRGAGLTPMSLREFSSLVCALATLEGVKFAMREAGEAEAINAEGLYAVRWVRRSSVKGVMWAVC